MTQLIIKNADVRQPTTFRIYRVSAEGKMVPVDQGAVRTIGVEGTGYGVFLNRRFDVTYENSLPYAGIMDVNIEPESVLLTETNQYEINNNQELLNVLNNDLGLDAVAVTLYQPA